MLLRWTEVDETGNEVVRNNYPVMVENACNYARKNHRVCHGRGYQHFDSGWINYIRVDDNGNRHLERKSINPRIIACQCVITNIEKFGI